MSGRIRGLGADANDEHKDDMLSIPKKFQSIWLGKLPPEDGKQNLLNWKKVNPDYEANLWVDSRTYSAEQMSQFQELKKWAIENGIRLRDVNSGEEFPDKSRLATDADKKHSTDKTSHSDSKENVSQHGFPNQQYYEAEIQQPDANFGAASDILRVEILFREGGIYVDFRDVFPNKPIEGLNPDYGFSCRWSGEGLCNDILASVPEGDIISNMRRIIQENYKKLYENAWAVRAHRNFLYSLPGLSNRRESTIDISGSGAMITAINVILHSLIKTHLDSQKFVVNKVKDDAELNNYRRKLSDALDASTKFPANCFALPLYQCHDWIPRINEADSYKEFVRNFAYYYLSYQIKTYIQSESYSYAIQILKEWDNLLNSAAAGSVNMVLLSQQFNEILLQNENTSVIGCDSIQQFLTKFRTIADAVENHFFEYIKEYLNPKELVFLFKSLQMEKDTDNKLFKKNFFDFFDKIFFEARGRPARELLQVFVSHPLISNDEKEKVHVASLGFFKSPIVEDKSRQIKWMDKQAILLSEDRLIFMESHGPGMKPMLQMINPKNGELVQDERFPHFFPFALPEKYQTCALSLLPADLSSESKLSSGEKLVFTSAYDVTLLDCSAGTFTEIYSSNNRGNDQLVAVPMNDHQLVLASKDGLQFLDAKTKARTSFGNGIVSDIVVLDQEKNIIVKQLDRIIIFNKEGVQKKELKMDGEIMSMTVLDNNSLVVSIKDKKSLSIYSQSGQLAGQVVMDKDPSSNIKLMKMVSLSQDHIGVFYHKKTGDKETPYVLICDGKTGNAVHSAPAINFKLGSDDAFKFYCESKLAFIRNVSSYRRQFF